MRHTWLGKRAAQVTDVCAREVGMYLPLEDKIIEVARAYAYRVALHAITDTIRANYGNVMPPPSELETLIEEALDAANENA